VERSEDDRPDSEVYVMSEDMLLAACVNLCRKRFRRSRASWRCAN
jgi:hypothetical protein